MQADREEAEKQIFMKAFYELPDAGDPAGATGAARRARHGGAAPAARCAHDGGAASTRCGAGVALGRAVGRPPNERAAAPTVEQQAAVPRLRLEGLDAHV